MICPNCGNRLRNKSKTCKNCGWSNDGLQRGGFVTDNGLTEKKQRKLPVYAIVIIAAAAALVLIVIASLIINALKPDESVHIHSTEHCPAVSATCTRPGNIEYWYCDGCGHYFADSEGKTRVDYSTEIVVNVEHSFTILRTTATHHWYECDTCHAEDVEKRHYGGEANCIFKAECELCSYAYGTVDSTNHNGETYIQNAIEPTDTDNGYSGDVYCKDCGSLIRKGTTTTLKTQNSQTHKHTAKSYWNSDKTQHWKNCIDCYAKLYTAAHTFGAYSYNGDATTAKDGTKTRTCTVCAYKDTVSASGTKLSAGSTPATKPTKPATEYAFTDVPATAWYKQSVDYAVKSGIFGGKSAGKFAPSDGITRAEFVQVLANLSGIDCSNKNISTVFKDVKRGSWYAPAVKWANDNRIVSGVGTTKFDPNAKITREQMCVMIVNYARYCKVTFEEESYKMNFSDDDKISSWAKSAVYTCQKANLINGKSGNRFAPSDVATRAEAATIFTAFHKKYLQN